MSDKFWLRWHSFCLISEAERNTLIADTIKVYGSINCHIDKNPPLIMAVDSMMTEKKYDVVAIQQMIDAGADVNALSNFKETPLERLFKRSCSKDTERIEFAKFLTDKAGVKIRTTTPATEYYPARIEEYKGKLFFLGLTEDQIKILVEIVGDVRYDRGFGYSFLPKIGIPKEMGIEVMSAWRNYDAMAHYTTLRRAIMCSDFPMVQFLCERGTPYDGYEIIISERIEHCAFDLNENISWFLDDKELKAVTEKGEEKVKIQELIRDLLRKKVTDDCPKLYLE